MIQWLRRRKCDHFWKWKDMDWTTSARASNVRVCGWCGEEAIAVNTRIEGDER